MKLKTICMGATILQLVPFLVWVAVLRLVHGIGAGGYCGWSSFQCSRYIQGECDTGLVCARTQERNYYCGSASRCLVSATELPTRAPTLRPTPDLKRAGELCDGISVRRECDFLRGQVFRCEGGLECGGSVTTSCGTYRFCRTVPTASPTQSPIVTAGLGERCCPVDRDCENDPPCAAPNRCIGGFTTSSSAAELLYTCRAPAPTGRPTTLAPTSFPSKSPTIENRCVDCATGLSDRSRCLPGSFCIPDGDRGAVSSCVWSCRAGMDLPPSAVDGGMLVIANSSSGAYTSVRSFHNDKYIVAANPSQGLVELFEGDQLSQTFSGLFGASIDTKGDTLVVGAPESNSVYVYESRDNSVILQKVLRAEGENLAGCGRRLVMRDDATTFFATCDSGAVVVGAKLLSGAGWAIVGTVRPRSIFWSNFGRSIASARDTLAVGFDGGVLVMDIERYVLRGQREFQYYRILRPDNIDATFGHSVVLNLFDNYILVGTNSSLFYSFTWDGYLETGAQRIQAYDVPSRDIVFEPYTFRDLSFARSSSKALVYKDGNFVSSEWGPPFLPYSDFHHSVSVAAVGSSQRHVYVRGGRITIANSVITAAPSKSPTPQPTGSPSAAPSAAPFFEYVKRNGRSCGLLPGALLGSQERVSVDECKQSCTDDTACRCFDFRMVGESNTVAPVPTCTFYSAYDSDIRWTAGRTHSFVKISENVLNVRLNVYVVDAAGDLVTGKDIRAGYDVDIGDIKVHTTDGQVGIVWRYVPDAYSPPSDPFVKASGPISSTNPYPDHPVTYDGYISVVGAKILAVDYEFMYLRNVASQHGATFLVSATVTDDVGSLVFYNTHIYKKERTQQSCPDAGGVPYSPADPPRRFCLSEAVPSSTAAPEGFRCETEFPPTVTLGPSKADITFYNDGYRYPDFEIAHCHYDGGPSAKARERRVDAVSLIRKRSDSKSQFVFSPDTHAINWGAFESAHVPDPADTPVKLLLYNLQDGEPLVLSDVVLRDRTGKKIRRLDASEVTFIGGDSLRHGLNTGRATCPYAGTKLIQSCPAFDKRPCCGSDPFYSVTKRAVCRGVRSASESFAGAAGDVSRCREHCNDDVECVAFTFDVSSSSGTVSCKYFSTVAESKDCGADCTSACYSSGDAKSTRFPVKHTFAEAFNDVTETVHGCNTDRSAVYVEYRGVDPFPFCPSHAGTADPELTKAFPWYRPPVSTVVNSRAAIEFEVDGKEVEYVDIGVGGGTDNKPSSYYYKLFHHDLQIGDGVFYSAASKDSHWRSIHINNAGDDDKNPVVGRPFSREALQIYNTFCDTEIGEEWYNSHTIISILNRGGITISELCVDLETAYSTRNPLIFNDVALLFVAELDDTLELFEGSFLDGTYQSFIKYETSNEREFPTSVASVASAIKFLISVDRMFDCSSTTEPSRLENFDATFLAESLLLEHRFPTRYKSYCDDLRNNEDMRYRGARYNVGRQGAPCISNAMCTDDLVCVDYYCAPLANVSKGICAPGEAALHPLYFGLRPPNPEIYGCAHSEVYSDNGYGKFSFPKGNNPGAEQSYGKVSTYEKIVYDEYMTRMCVADNFVTVALDHFRNRGNFQGCNNFFTSEIVDSGTSVQLSEYGRENCLSRPFLDRLVAATNKRGEYDRLVPKKMWDGNRDVLNKYTLGGDHNQLPVSFALENGDEITMLADMLDAQCLYPNAGDLSFSGTGVVNEVSCADVEGCVWSDSLRQCVASRQTIEANFCPMVQDEDQCKLTGFCAWNDADDSCFSPANANLEFNPNRNKENQCEIIFDPFECGYASCIWDIVQQSCHATWDTVTQLHDTIKLSAVQGSSDSLNKYTVRKNPRGDKKTIEGNTLRWPACSNVGELDKGVQIARTAWTYYPSPGRERFLAGYDQDDVVGVGMSWVKKSYGETVTNLGRQQRVTYDLEHWEQPRVERFGSTTNKMCFEKKDLYNQKMCLGYGFRWNSRQKICSFSGDYTYDGVETIVPIAATVLVWVAPGLYGLFNKPNQHTWDAMVNEHFDDNDHGHIQSAGEVVFHGYQYMRFGCYTRITKAHCENTAGQIQHRATNGIAAISSDSGCVWLPLIDKCIARSDRYNVYKSVFQMPSAATMYNSTVGALPHVKRRTALKTYNFIDENVLHWDSQFQKNYNPAQASQLFEDLQLCQEHTVYDECVMNEACFWDFGQGSCQVSMCSAMMLLTPDRTLQRVTGSLKDLRETTVRAKSCERMIGCALDPITHTCGPDDRQPFNQCPTGYTMVNSYMSAYVCPPDKVVVGTYCVDPKHVHCPWGTTKYYQPSFIMDRKWRGPSIELSRSGRVEVTYDEDTFLKNWQGGDTKFPKIQSSICNQPDVAPNKWPRAKAWENDESHHRPGLRDQGIVNKCIAFGAPDREPAATLEHAPGEFSAAARAHCAALKSAYGVCNVHVEGKDFVCMDIRGDCTVRYPAIESMSVQKIHEYVAKAVFDPENGDVDRLLMEIFNYVDADFDIASDAFFTMYYSEADLQLIDGLKDKVLSNRELLERFEEYYVPNYYQKLQGYSSYNPEDGWPAYEPEYEIVRIRTLDFTALGMEMIGNMKLDYRKDIERALLAETYTDTYLQWKEIQMAVTDGHIDHDLHIVAALETSQLRELFWDQRDYWSFVYNQLWAGSLETDADYEREVDALFEKDGAVTPWSRDDGVADLAKAYLLGEVSEMYFEHFFNNFVDQVAGLRDKGTFLVHYHFTHAAVGWAQIIGDILDAKFGKGTNTFRYKFNYDTTVDILEKFFQGSAITETEVLQRHEWPDIVVRKRPASVEVVRSKVVKKVSTVVPYHRRTKVVRNHLSLVPRVQAKFPSKLGLVPAPKLIDAIPVPADVPVAKFKKLTKVPSEIYDSYITQYFKKMDGKVVHNWVPNGAIKSHHAVMKKKFKSGFKIHELRQRARKLPLREIVQIKKHALQKANIQKKGTYVANLVRVRNAREKLVESVRLRNQLIAVVNNARLFEHNVRNTEQLRLITEAWSDTARSLQKPNVRLSQTIDVKTTKGLAIARTRVDSVLTSLKVVKQPGAISLVPKTVDKVVNVVRKAKQSKIIKYLRFAGKFFKPFFAFLNFLDTAVTIMEIFNAVKFALENPKGCSAVDAFIGIPSDPLEAIANVFNGPKLALRFRAIVLQDVDDFSKEYRCAERMSWAMFNADGRYGIVDYRYQVPECQRSFNHRLLDYHFSNNEKGINIECQFDRQCKLQSSVGKCVYNRCVYDAHFLGMKVCKVKKSHTVVFLDTPLQKVKYLNTDYDTFNLFTVTDPPEKFHEFDEMLSGRELLRACGGNTRFAEYQYFPKNGTGFPHVFCFDECEQWIKNVDHTIETWMLTMPSSNAADAISISDDDDATSQVNKPCENSTECTQGGICSSDHKCTPPIHCSRHRHCYGGYYLPGRLPRCDCNTFRCVDDTARKGCDDIDSCEEEANDVCEFPTTDAPTASPTESPTSRRPTGSPTQLPTASPTAPTAPETLPPGVSLSPTAAPTGHTPLSTFAPTVLSPTTARPTRSPTVPGPFAGAACDFNKTDHLRCSETGDNFAYIPDIDSHTEVLEFVDNDHSTCESACRNTKDCRLYFVEHEIDSTIRCTYFSSPANETATGPAGADVIGCFEKEIPCTPTASPTVHGPTASPTVAPTFNASDFDLQCNYGTLQDTKLGDFDFFAEVFDVFTELQCMESCDTSIACEGFQYEPVARKCILYSALRSAVHYSRASVFQKTGVCPVSVAPTVAPTAYTPQYASVVAAASRCEYEELPSLEFEETEPILIESNSSVGKCVNLCDEVPPCSLASFENATGRCELHGKPTGHVFRSSRDDGTVWFNKTEDNCLGSNAPTGRPTDAPTAVPAGCTFTSFENSTFSEFVVDDVITDVRNYPYECEKSCNERGPSCTGFVFNSSSCVLFESFNETSKVFAPHTEIKVKDDPGCTFTVSPTGSPTSFPSRSPTIAEIEVFLETQTEPPSPPTTAPSASPSIAPTLSPTGSPTETITCNYARLPGFGPRRDAVFSIQHKAHNESASHDEHSCTLSCDSDDRCIAFSYHADVQACTFYDIVGPIELKLGEHVALSIKSKACTIPHDVEGRGGCTYLERPEQGVSQGIGADGQGTLQGAPSALDCADECDRDGTCRMFVYHGPTSACRFFFAVTEWRPDSFSTGYVKSDPNCVRPPTRMPRHVGVTVVDIENDEVRPWVVVVLTASAALMVAGCCVIALRDRRDKTAYEYL